MNDVEKQIQDHIEDVRMLIECFVRDVMKRAIDHDKTKLEDKELHGFVEYNPKLKSTTYGTKEYFDLLKKLKPTLDHHYKNNRHHPEYHENGVNGMTLIDLVEMFFDWQAATRKHDDGDINKSIEINKDRFGISDQICDIFRNTAKQYENGLKD